MTMMGVSCRFGCASCAVSTMCFFRFRYAELLHGDLRLLFSKSRISFPHNMVYVAVGPDAR